MIREFMLHSYWQKKPQETNGTLDNFCLLNLNKLKYILFTLNVISKSFISQLKSVAFFAQDKWLL